MINKNKASSRSYLFLSGVLLLIMLAKAHMDNPLQWKPPQDLPKKAKKSTAEYNRQHSTK